MEVKAFDVDGGVDSELMFARRDRVMDVSQELGFHASRFLFSKTS